MHWRQQQRCELHLITPPGSHLIGLVNVLTVSYLCFSLQVIDRGIMSNGFNATCWLGNTSLACNIVGVTANQMNISLPLLDAAMEGQAITFNVGYIYELCVNDILEAILTGVKLFNVLCLLL